MPYYRVTWEIDIDAASPLEAARKARASQIREGTIAVVFDVFEDGKEKVRVDLMEAVPQGAALYDAATYGYLLDVLEANVEAQTDEADKFANLRPLLEMYLEAGNYDALKESMAGIMLDYGIEAMIVRPARPDGQTQTVCYLCKDRHPVTQGITHYQRSFECDHCGAAWSDTWCSDCNDKCPDCNREIEPSETSSETVIEAELPATQ